MPLAFSPLASPLILSPINSLVPVKIWLTCIFPSVRVPVLSVQIIVTLPNVSVAASFLTSPFCLKMRLNPKTKITVIAGSRPAGIAETARAKDAIKTSIKLFPVKYPSARIIAIIKSTKAPSHFERTDIFCCNGVLRALASLRRETISPICVLIPVAMIIIVPRPSSTIVPIKTILVLSESNAFSDKESPAVLSTACDSPVRLASFTFNPFDSITRPSAGTLSPDFNITTSPATNSSLSISFSLPSRKTLALTLTIFFNAKRD